MTSINLARTGWLLKAFCRGANPDLFFASGNEEAAKAYCARCSVITPCLKMATDEKLDGVWGGTTEDERKALKRGGVRASCPGCRSQTLATDGVSEICVSCGLTWRV